MSREPRSENSINTYFVVFGTLEIGLKKINSDLKLSSLSSLSLQGTVIGANDSVGLVTDDVEAGEFELLVDAFVSFPRNEIPRVRADLNILLYLVEASLDFDVVVEETDDVLYSRTYGLAFLN